MILFADKITAKSSNYETTGGNLAPISLYIIENNCIFC
jgi:hypothetical protein